jgi:hypothetical protein
MPTQRESAAESRQLKLDDLKRQIADGSLTVREMTEEERLQYPPRPPSARRTSRYGGSWKR